jgi:hypothetical protein
VRDRRVRLIRVRHGDRHTVGQDTTSATGQFAIRLSGSKAKNGRYYGRVPKATFDSGHTVCEGARSRAITVSL